MAGSDCVFGAGFGYAGLVLFRDGQLGPVETMAMAVVLAVYALNRVALFLTVMGVPRMLLSEPVSSENSPQTGLVPPLPHTPVEERTSRAVPTPGTTTPQAGGRQ